MTVTLCELSDLPPDQCAHCRGHDASAVPGPSVTPAQGPRRQVPPEQLDIVCTFPARFDGRCSNCAGRIDAGTIIGRTGDEDYVCSGCLP